MALSRVASVACILLAVSSCVISSAQQHDHEVEGIERDEDGKLYIRTDAGEKYLVYRDQENMQIFYFNPVTMEPQWNDPRKPLPEREPTEPPPKIRAPAEKLSAAFIATIPVMLFIIGMAARIYYLHTYYPELLFPVKERKGRQRSSGKLKPQKARGKMSQDGKGGRSANS